MKFSLPMRMAVCILSGVGVLLLSYSAMPGEAFFWTFISVTGVSAFLLVKPAVAMKERVGMIGLWNLMAPVVLTVFATVNNPAEIMLNALRLVFLTMFFVGAGVATRLFFKRDQTTKR